MKYTKARFFKCALQLNPYSYITYRGQQHTMTEDEYNQQLVDACLEAQVEVVGIADHGSVKELDKLRNLFIRNGIVVFPGFEISSSEKVHFVCLFGEDKTSQELERILGRLSKLDPAEGILPTDLSAVQLIDAVEEIGGFVFAAHSTTASGVLKSKMNHIWKYPKLRAAQIPANLSDLKGGELDFYRDVFLNKNAEYRRERPMAAINAADIKEPAEVANPRATCLIKMTQPCFDSFKQAFLDPGSRVRLNSEKPENYASAIERIRFVGGYLDGLDIELSEHLNAVIGGRGTGKSTLLECIRFAMNMQAQSTEAKLQHKKVIDSNLAAGGMVKLTVRSATMHGRRFEITRKFGDQPVVVDDAGKVSPHQPRDLLPGLELYGQNEIFELTRNQASRNQLIERFLDSEHAEFDVLIEKVQQRLVGNRGGILGALQARSDILADVERLPKLQDQAKQFKALGLDEKLKIVPKLEKERQLVALIDEELNRTRESLDFLKDNLPDLAFIADQVLEGLPHAALFAEQRKALNDLDQALKQGLLQFEKAYKTSVERIDPLQEQLELAIEGDEQTLEKAFGEIPSSQGKTGRQIGAEYQQLLKRIEQIKPKQAAVQTRDSQLRELYAERKKLLLELAEANSGRLSKMQKSIKSLNKKLDGKVRLTLNNESNRRPILDYLLGCRIEGVGERRLEWVLSSDFSPAALAETIRQGEQALKTAGWDSGLTASVIQGLCKLQESQLLELEELTLPEEMGIELNVTHGEQTANFKQIDDLSTGQQCTAVLHLLLLENEDPLILDQPEDNLDNAFIAERIVAELRDAKLSRQFLFATHNANIPVFGDAEWIGVLSVDEGKGRILPEQQGAIDLPAIQRLAAEILEGGKSAFNQRREKYGFQ